MGFSERLLAWETGAVGAGRQAALLFLLASLSAFASILGQPEHVGLLVTIGLADLATAGVAWMLPWDRWDPALTAVLGLPAFVILGLSTWTYGGFAAGTGPFFVLCFAWLGLHHRPRLIVACFVPAAACYLVPLVAMHASAQVLSSAVVLSFASLVLGLLSAVQVRRLREERDRATRAETWRAALMATLAHDIRSPLTTVQGTLTLLGDVPDLPADRQRSLIDAALRQTRRLTSLATGLLDLERVEQGRLRLDRRWVPVAAVAADAAELVGTKTDVVVRVPPGLLVHADPERLEQVLVNLITNGLRHGRPPVVVTANEVGSAVRIEVRDHGAGVPDGLQPALFRRHGADAGGSDSVGLGLWIARLLVDAHGGSVGYEPADPGARFTVHLPGPGAAETERGASTPAGRAVPTPLGTTSDALGPGRPVGADGPAS